MLIRLASINISPLHFAVHSQFNSTTFSICINKMTQVISIVGDSNVNCNLDSAKAANPSDHCLRQSYLVVAFNAVQLQSSHVSQNEHRRVVVLAALSNPITCFTFLGGDQLIIDVRLFLQQLCSWIQLGRNFDDGNNHTVFVLPPSSVFILAGAASTILPSWQSLRRFSGPLVKISGFSLPSWILSSRTMAITTHRRLDICMFITSSMLPIRFSVRPSSLILLPNRIALNCRESAMRSVN